MSLKTRRGTQRETYNDLILVGPVVNCHMPKDRVTQTHQGYGFVEFLSEEDADYAIKILNMIKLYGKPGKILPLYFLLE